uniref:Protein Vpu n=1 Tax=Human immunodeficiency virus type 1 TaxID=11676 RepID=Q6Y8U3_HV1|nr:vpu protein [Human immunodeficiency virus 1]
MHYRDLLILIVVSALLLINIVIWTFILKKYLEQKKQDRRERELLNRIKRIREVRDDSDYESNGEEEQEVMHLVHTHGFANPMFEF